MTTAERKRAALELQNNPLLLEILEQMQSKTIGTWRACGDPVQREALWHQSKAITQFGSNLNVAIKRAAGDGAHSTEPGE